MMLSGSAAVGVRLPVYLLRLGLASASGATARFYSTIPESKQKYVPSDGTYPKGFRVSGVHAGVKPSNTTKPDLALLVAETGDQEYQCTAHAVFTTARYVAAPVVYTKEALSRTSTTHGVQAVIINSGCANAITGQGGMEDAAKMAQVTKEVVTHGGRSQHDGETLVMSTGVIGQRLPMDRIVGKIPSAYEALGDSHDHWLGFAQAICTTDTFPKLLSRTFKLPHSDIEYRIAGTVKGAGMIHPDMATLLGVIATDVPMGSKALKSSLTHAVDNSFNRITIDGAMSTNDTVALLASGAAGGPVIGYSGSSDPDSYSKAIYPAFREVLTDFARDLAHLIVRDGEGATKFVTINVRGAPTPSAAKEAARGIALSALVKTALYGNDANWGRIISAVGQALPLKRASLEEPKAINNVDLSFIPSDGSPELKLLVQGEPEVVDEARASQVLGLEDIEIVVNLNEGKGSCTYWTCDLSPEYVSINGDYRT